MENMMLQLFAAIDAADAAAQRYAAAMQKLAGVRLMKYTQIVNDNGEVVYFPKDARLSELRQEPLPDGVLPKGRSAADEREAAAVAWLRQNNGEYARLERELEQAEVMAALANGEVQIAERQSHAANAKVLALKAAVELRTAEVNNDTAQAQLRRAAA